MSKWSDVISGKYLRSKIEIYKIVLKNLSQGNESCYQINCDECPACHNGINCNSDELIRQAREWQMKNKKTDDYIKEILDKAKQSKTPGRQS